MSDEFPQEGRIAGIDYGSVRIGIAISDPQRILSSPYENYTRRDTQSDAAFFRQLANEERIVAWIVGLPVHSSGDESQKSIEAREFGEWLSEVTGRPVRYYDEDDGVCQQCVCVCHSRYTEKFLPTIQHPDQHLPGPLLHNFPWNELLEKRSIATVEEPTGLGDITTSVEDDACNRNTSRRNRVLDRP